VTFLLDINVLIALIDPAHVGHDAAHRWFEARGRESWATCPLTGAGLAVARGGHPATFDHRLSTKAVKGGKSLHLIAGR
jgi:uncharacterized protein